MTLEHRYTAQLGRTVALRDNNSDKQMWEDTFVIGYNTPPEEIPVPKLVLDLGANIGLTAAAYKELWPDALVLMVEPNPDNMALARKNAPLCVPVQCAVARESGYRYLREEGQTASAYSLEEDGRKVYAIGMQSLVECLVREIDFCKMDVEGVEWEILEQPLPSVRHLMVEFHTSDGDYDRSLVEGIELLSAAGWNARHYPLHHPAAVYATR